MAGYDFLINERGEPEVPSYAREALREIDPRLDLLWHRGCASFALTYRWAEDAPQRDLIRRGDLPPHHDFEIIGWVPPHVGMGDLAGYAQGLVERAAQHREDIKRSYDAYNDRLQAQNAAVLEAAAAEVMDDTVREITSASTLAGRRRRKVEMPEAAAA